MDKTEPNQVPNKEVNKEHGQCRKLPLILASASPRRKELLARIREDFTSEISGVDETVPDTVSIPDTAEYLSGLKARDIFARHPDEEIIVIGSDTVVIHRGRIYGKPGDEEDAYAMLSDLQGDIHEVRTGVTLLWRRKEDGGLKEQSLSFTSVTKVRFCPMTPAEIRHYIHTGEPKDKAGSYGIQGPGALYIEGIEGDYYTVMGFPVSEVYRRMKEYGLVEVS